MRRAKSGISWVLSGDSAFLWSGDGYLWRLLGFHKGCQVPFLLPRGKVGFLRKHCSIKGPHLAWRGEFHGFCGVVVGSSWLLSSCMGTWGTRSCFLREVRSTFELRGAPRDSSCIAAQMNRASSRVEARTSGFLSISDIDLRVSVEFEQGRQALSCVEACNSGSVSSSWKLQEPWQGRGSPQMLWPLLQKYSYCQTVGGRWEPGGYIPISLSSHLLIFSSASNGTTQLEGCAGQKNTESESGGAKRLSITS